MTVDDRDFMQLGWTMQDLPRALSEHEDNSHRRVDFIARVLINWYDAAIFFLEKAEFMRYHDKRSIQAIAMFSAVSNNIGDGTVQMTYRSAAIRIGQSLRLGSQHTSKEISRAERESDIRLWWTLLICEWLAIPYQPPCIGPYDFDMELPQAWDDGLSAGDTRDVLNSRYHQPNQPHQAQYHLAMISIARIHQAFRGSLVRAAHDAQETLALVQRTDDALANMIDTLPAHLRNDASCIFETADSKNITLPWIELQRNQLALALLYYRMVVNRVMQDYWIESPHTYATSQAICIGSARAITSLIDDSKTTDAQLRPW